ncbi:MAG: PTS lactose/cellobiose transporter subunit IIA [Coprobacillus sp.]|nr:PTS lactose/cellobiose transporter subunit IIA [Coprobacillus sp.]
MVDKKGTSIKREELISTAMAIILHAGDARAKIDKALSEVKSLNLDVAKNDIEEAKKELHKAHVCQMNIISNEASGQFYEASLLFNHAQDTLMTTMSEERIISQMIDVFEIMFKKIEGGLE